MARIPPTRPKYWRKSNPVVYVVAARMYVRARAKTIRNPRTPKQQANRSKMAVASRFLSQMQPMVARGFRGAMTRRPGWQSRGVGGYHVGLGLLLNTAMERVDGAWRVDYERVKLAEGNSLKPFPLEASRNGREVILHFPSGLPRGTLRVRVAVHSARRQRTVHLGFAACAKGEAVRLDLPKWAVSGDLHMYYTVDVRGRSRWASAYVFLPEERGEVDGGAVGGRIGGLAAGGRGSGVSVLGFRYARGGWPPGAT